MSNITIKEVNNFTNDIFDFTDIIDATDSNINSSNMNLANSPSELLGMHENVSNVPQMHELQDEELETLSQASNENITLNNQQIDNLITEIED